MHPALLSAHAGTHTHTLLPLQAMLNYLVGGIVCLTGVMMAAKFALDK